MTEQRSASVPAARTGAADGAEPVIELSNEFAYVRISVDRRANGLRLRVDCPRTGAVGYLDPLEIESLAVASPDVRAAVVNPEHRWR